MKLILAQGNIGPEYSKTRHNIGFLVIDFLAEKFAASWQEKPKFKAAIAEATIAGQKTLLVKPSTLYNATGEAVTTICQFYKIPSSDVLVIHDELALPFGTIRTRLGGSDAGNNGIKSLISHLGADFARIRIGIANDHLRPDNAVNFVLGRLNSAEQQALPEIAKHSIVFIEHFVRHEAEFLPTSLKISL